MSYALWLFGCGVSPGLDTKIVTVKRTPGARCQKCEVKWQRKKQIQCVFTVHPGLDTDLGVADKDQKRHLAQTGSRRSVPLHTIPYKMQWNPSRKALEGRSGAVAGQ